MVPDRPRKSPWITHGIAAAIAAAIFCILIAAADGSIKLGITSFAMGGLPFAGVIAFLSFLATGGFRTRNLCGYCGYDRKGFKDASPCPECGRAYDPNSPGYKPIGRRSLPWWLWFPALLPIPLIMLATRVPVALEGPYILLCLGLTAGAIILAGIHSWRQVR